MSVLPTKPVTDDNLTRRTVVGGSMPVRTVGQSPVYGSREELGKVEQRRTMGKRKKRKRVKEVTEQEDVYLVLVVVLRFYRRGP